MNPKISRLRAEREKNNGKIAALQTRNREIDSQIMELENTDIIGMVRESGFTPEQLARLLQSMRQGQFPAPEAERAKNDEKIAALQSRNRELDESIVELENTDIIGLARATGMSMEELAQFLTQLKRGGAPFITPSTKEDTDYVHEEE